MKTETIIEDNQGNVIGFRGEETLTEIVAGKTLNRGDRTSITILPPEKVFHRSLILRVQKDSLGLDAKDLPAFLGSAPEAELDTPENLKLFAPIPEPEPDLGKAILEAMEARAAKPPRTPAPGPR